ncbi:hypothetical protein D770_08455 [Flammeovirgaceae bacterium 311]|nr:hypothetical protein D770_08455 [Flammeovirgaceae bacterium 311]
MMLLGACGSDQNTTDEVYAPETEMVNREVETDEYAEDRVATTETTTVDQDMSAANNTNASSSTASSNWNNGSMSASSVNINRLLDQHPDVNQAIRSSLASMEYEQGVSNDYTME